MSGHGLSLYLKNTTVGLVLVIPWLIVALATSLDKPKAGDSSPLPFDDQPPIITLSEAEGYTFDVGSAVLSASFAVAIDSTVLPRIRDLAREYQCDIVEIVGHTDGQPVGGRSNIDFSLIPDSTVIDSMTAGSNADLGLMRAWAVRQQLLRNGGLANLRIHALSAAALIMPSGDDADPRDRSDQRFRRRIEIRLRRTPTS